MRDATTAAALPVDTRSDRRTRVLLAVACVMLAGLIYAVVARDEAVSCPNELIGAWETSAKGYEDGMLVFDRNFNGVIESGAEISFLGDVAGATSDLEGLGAFDSNANGAFDKGDTWFGAFNIWQDRNQDGVSQKGELASLADHGIVSINLTRSNVQPNSGNLTENAIIARSTFTRSDGSVGEIGDVMLAYGASREGGDGEADRTANSPSSRQKRGGGSGGGGGIAPPDRRDDEAEPAPGHGRKPRQSQHTRDEERSFNPFANSLPANDRGETEPMQAQARGALHGGLGVMDRKLLGMIDAMAQFEASSSAENGLGRRKLDPRVAELLTSLPDLR